MLMKLVRRTGAGNGSLKPSISAPPSARSMRERAPLMQSGHTIRPLSSTSFSGSVGRPHTTQFESSDGMSSSGGGSPRYVIADTLAPASEPPDCPVIEPGDDPVG